MSLTAKENGGGKSFEIIEEGTHPAVCYGMVDIGEQKTNYNGEEKSADKIIILWEVSDATITIDGKEMPRGISKTYTNSLHEKAGLRKDLKSWRGKEFTEAELAGFNLENIIGAPCLINIVHTEKDGRTYANISSIMALPKGMPKPQMVNPKLIFNMDTATEADLKKLPEWIQKKITESVTWKMKMLVSKTDKAGGDQQQFEELEDDDGDLPF
jgi:hypothetical protein